MFCKSLIFLSFLIYVNWSLIEAYKTVVLVHGLDSDGDEFRSLKPRIEKAHIGTNVVELNYSRDHFSVDPLKVQLESFKHEIDKVFDNIPRDDEIHLICHSQGMYVHEKYIFDVTYSSGRSHLLYY